MEIPSNFEHEKFSASFLEEYLKNGFGTMSKRELDLHVLKLLLEHNPEWDSQSPPKSFVLAEKLRAKSSKIRGLLDELSFRNANDAEATKKRLGKLLEHCEKIDGGQRVKLQIEDAYLRGYAKNRVVERLGVVDASFDRTILTLNAEHFMALAVDVSDSKTVTALKKKLKAKLGDNLKGKGDFWDTFLKAFAKSAGKTSGEKLVSLGFKLLTGGLSDVGDLITSVTQVLKPTK
jgi:hypothetical protein